MSDIVDGLKAWASDIRAVSSGSVDADLLNDAANTIHTQAATIADLTSERDKLREFLNSLPMTDRARAALKECEIPKPKAPLPAMGAGQETGGAALQGNRPKPWDEPPPVAPVPQRPPHQED